MSPSPTFSDRRVRLKARLRTTFAAIATLTGVSWLWRSLFARHGVRVLAYHGVETPPSNPFAVSIEDFERQVAHLAETCDVIDLAAIRQWQTGGDRSGKPKVALTFDDGFRNNLKNAAPILGKYGLPATFFVIASKLDGTDDRFMTASEVGELAKAGRFAIGSHSLNHRSIGRIGEQARQEEIAGSKGALEAALGCEIACFCYPYGMFDDFDQDSTEMLSRSGYALGCTSVNGVNFRRTDPYRLRRTKVEWSDDMTTFKRLLGGALDGWILVDYFLRFLQRPRAVRFDRERRAGTGSV